MKGMHAPAIQLYRHIVELHSLGWSSSEKKCLFVILFQVSFTRMALKEGMSRDGESLESGKGSETRLDILSDPVPGECGLNEVESHSCSSSFPGIKMMKKLSTDYGFKLLIMISLCAHGMKGFCRLQYAQSVRYLLQGSNVPGPRIDVYTSIMEVPWSMKPLIAICSDMLPIFGFKKAPYIVLTTILGILGLCASAFVNTSNEIVQISGLFLANFSWMTCDILVEGMYSRRMAEHADSGPDLVVFISLGQQFTNVISAVVSGAVMEGMDGVLGLSGAQWNISACLLPSVAVLAPALLGFLGEDRISREESKINRTRTWKYNREILFLSLFVGFGSLMFVCGGMLLDMDLNFLIFSLAILFLLNFSSWFFLTPIVGRLVLFLAIASVTNISMGGAAHYFYTDDAIAYPEGPHFDPWFFLTVCGLVGAAACVVALLVFSKFRSSKYTLVYVVLILMNAILTLPNSILYSRLNLRWGVSDRLFVGSDTALQTAMSALIFAPGFLLLSRACPDKLESSMFAILASNTNLAASIATPISAYICTLFGITPDGSSNESVKFDNMWLVNLLMAGIKLVPLFFLFLLPNVRMTASLPGVREAVTRDSPYNILVSFLAKQPSIPPPVGSV